MSTSGVIENYYRFANAGDWDRWCDLFAENQVMDEQLAGRVEGRETLRTMMAGFPDLYANFTNEPRRFVVDGDHAAVVSHISATTRGGDGIEAEVCNYFEVTDGLISYMSNYHDTKPFAPLFATTASKE